MAKKKWSLSAKQQLKNKTKEEFIKLLDRDPRWERVPSKGGSAMIFCNKGHDYPDDYVSIHYHPKVTFRDWGLLTMLLDTICWTEDYLKKEKVIK